jgi:hypothetical protein
MTVDRDTRKFVNTFHVARVDAGILDAADILNIANIFVDWWASSYKNAVTNQIAGDNVVVTKQDPSDPQQITLPLVGSGTFSGAVYPADVTAAVSWRTGLAGRKYRGRFYDFGVPDSQGTSQDTIQGGYQIILQNIAAYLLTHLVTGGYAGIVYHRADDTSTAITSIVVDLLLDSMRNRLAGRGQ